MASDKPIIIIGAGGHASVLAKTLIKQGRNILGFVEFDPKIAKARVPGLPILGDDAYVLGHPSNSILLVNGVGSTKDTTPRKSLFEFFKSKGYHFETVIHPTAMISSDAVIGEGCQVMMGAIVQSGVQVGSNSIMNSGSVLDHDCIIGPHCHIAPGAILSGSVKISESCHIGAGAVVIQSVSLGGHSLVAAGAVVTADFPERSRLFGIPAKQKGLK